MDDDDDDEDGCAGDEVSFVGFRSRVPASVNDGCWIRAASTSARRAVSFEETETEERGRRRAPVANGSVAEDDPAPPKGLAEPDVFVVALPNALPPAGGISPPPNGLAPHRVGHEVHRGRRARRVEEATSATDVAAVAIAPREVRPGANEKTFILADGADAVRSHSFARASDRRVHPRAASRSGRDRRVARPRSREGAATPRSVLGSFQRDSAKRVDDGERGLVARPCRDQPVASPLSPRRSRGRRGGHRVAATPSRGT